MVFCNICVWSTISKLIPCKVGRLLALGPQEHVVNFLTVGLFYTNTSMEQRVVAGISILLFLKGTVGIGTVLGRCNREIECVGSFECDDRSGYL